MKRLTMRLTMVLNDVQHASLDALLATGRFGFTRVEVARRLLDEGLRKRCEEGWLAMPAARRKAR